MSEELKLIFDPKHHAVIVFGEPAELVSVVKDRVMKHSPESASDIWSQAGDYLTIEISHQIKNWQSTKPLAGDFKWGIWGFAGASTEAQNALLKVLEEPTSQSKIILIFPHEGILLPTILSRVCVVKTTGDLVSKDWNKEAQEFIVSNPGQRQFLLKDNFNYEDEDIKQKITKFLSALEKVLHNKIKDNNKPSPLFIEIIKAKKNLSDRGSAPRLVMDHLIGVLPILKK